LSEARSSSFLVEGTPDLRFVASALWDATFERLAKAGELRSSAVLAPWNTLTVQPEGTGALCAQIPAEPPYRSSVKACAPRSAVFRPAGITIPEASEISIDGHVSVLEGELSREDAVAAAQAVADPPYLARVAFSKQPDPARAGYNYQRDGDFYDWSRKNPFATTYLANEPSLTAYRTDLRAWVIVLDEIMAGGSLPESQRFADKVLVLVDRRGRACVLETVPYRGRAFSLDPKAAQLGC